MSIETISLKGLQTKPLTQYSYAMVRSRCDSNLGADELRVTIHLSLNSVGGEQGAAMDTELVAVHGDLSFWRVATPSFGLWRTSLAFVTRASDGRPLALTVEHAAPTLVALLAIIP
mmetsp:Transcript_16339/g.51131  ORF Transcript_16339/g.51131 Transcript_16339/m.51131 type:complete len:116 (-) Transcript_16339:301-648(-)